MQETTHLKTVDEHGAAVITGWSVKTLQRRRWLGQPPTFLRIGRKIRYKVSDLEAYLNSCTVEPVRQG